MAQICHVEFEFNVPGLSNHEDMFLKPLLCLKTNVLCVVCFSIFQESGVCFSIFQESGVLLALFFLLVA